MKKVLFLDLPIFLILAALAKSIAYFPLDLYITRSLQQINSTWFDYLMKALSFLGEPPRFIPLVALVVLMLFLFRKKADSVLVFISFSGAALLGLIFKFLVGRVRPDPTLIHQYVPQLARDSFPSGHVLAYIGFFGALLIIVRKLKPGVLKKVMQIILISLIILIGVSRIYLGEHWFSDVLGSYLLGIAWLYFIQKAYLLV